LYKKLLGPQFGSTEIIEQPFGKYQVGILTSCFHSESLDEKMITDPSEKNFESPEKKSLEYVESTLDNDVQWPDTELDMDGSFTLGLSFLIKGKSPKIRICNTWGRYAYAKNLPPKMKIFQRQPNYYITDWLDVKSFENKEKQKIKLVSNKTGIVTQHGIELHIRASTSNNLENTWTVQIFLVNRTPYPDKDENGKPKRQNETHRIFQPQIRINKDKESVIEYLGGSSVDDKNELKDFLSYLERRTKARGFQCGAIWKEVDPEGYDGDDGFTQFSWPDGQIIPKDELDYFTCPTIRTEFLPVYSILQPETSKQQFDTEFLANEWDPTEIEKHLNPIAVEYENWISGQKSTLKNRKELPEKLVSAGLENLKGCEDSLLEIKKGIDFVCSDERARLAFCFMNRVMADKRKYDNRDKKEEDKKLHWREFQIGFILQSLRGVAGIDKAGQDLADVLWFPTGGGKTEAYLGITIFTIAYRRLLTTDEIKREHGEVLNNDGGVNVISRYTLRLLTIQQFQRALGAIIVSDMKRVQNWIPEKLKSTGALFKEQSLNERLSSGHIWGNSRFSIGLWIGGDATPTRFAYQPGGNKGRIILHAEGVLLSSRDPLKHPKHYYEPPKGDPAQIQNCPICGNLLSFPKDKPLELTGADVAWIIKTNKSIGQLESIPQTNFEDPHKTIQLREKPFFSTISEIGDGNRYVRVSMKLRISQKIEDVRDAIDVWWDKFVNVNFVSKEINSLVSTRAAMPGYFFLKRPGENRPYDFTIYCTNKSCDLNQQWFENINENHVSTIPEPFRKKAAGNVSSAVPISAFTIDEQVYFRCPTFIIATSDKFANLPWDSRCASLFGNVDCFHRYFGFGRQSDYLPPLLEKSGGKSKRIVTEESEFTVTNRFLPPSLIIQDELHLIEGPLGSMVGVYEMAIDVLCRNNTTGPKYIASSATIKEADTQIKTIFRKDIRTFPHPGIFASDNFFAKTKEDKTCIDSSAGRLYVGVCSAKSVFELPIKVCAILMSEIHQIRETPELYGLTKQTVDAEIDPYWTYVSYFTDLQLMSRFSGFYSDDIERDIKKFSPPRIGLAEITGRTNFPEGTRLIPLTADTDFTIFGVSVYCQNTKGKISTAIYNDHVGGKLVWSSEPKKCSNGENAFLSKEPIRKIKKGETVWIGIINDSDETLFRTVKAPYPHYEVLKNPTQDGFIFQQDLGKTKAVNGDAIQVELTGKIRDLQEENKIELSSETKSEDLPTNLEKLQSPMSADALLTSPVFGTGIDIDRLGLMNIMNQPKTTSSYIQATGRVGRRVPGLVVTWFSSRRTRDLDHYENFVGYHRKINSFVEPVTANPFSQESLELSLGPIVVAILRNASNVSGIPISKNWVNNTTGPSRILLHSNGKSEEINAVRTTLCKIASNPLIPEFRKNQNFETRLNAQLTNWLNLVEDLKENGKEIIYGERNPTRPVEKDVVLGTAFHEQRGFSSAFPNTRNSLRNTESTSIFHLGTSTKIPIRPSQYITRYGPGSLLPADFCSLSAPSIPRMISDLNTPIGNFEEDVNGKKKLRKIEIYDSKMKKMLRRFNKDAGIGDLHIFDMPTNASLNSKNHSVTDRDNIYQARLFPEWATCSKHLGDRIFAKIIGHPVTGRLAVKCPECLKQFKDKYSYGFSSVRFVMACQDGHMSDVDWTKQIHKETSCNRKVNDDDRVFIWDESSGGDNISFNCYGVWTEKENDLKFEETTCNAHRKYTDLKFDAFGGFMTCEGKFVEENHETGSSCDAPTIIARKSMMSLRSPIILSSLVIQQKKSRLFEKLSPYKETFVTAKLDVGENNTGWTSGDLADRLKKRQPVNKIGDGLIRDIRITDRQQLIRISDELQKEIDKEDADDTSLTESENLENELRSLENGIEEGSKQTRGKGTTQSSSVKYPIRWTSKSGLSFEAMPYSDIRVTMVQTGYTREISDPNQDKKIDDDPEKAIQMRLGSTVSKFSRYIESNTNFRWYLGNQSIGEGIFIHLDPQKHNESMQVFQSKEQDDFLRWKEFNKKVLEIGDKKLQDKKLNEEQGDMIESAQTKSNPLFVWWHSLAHQIIAGLSIDSGFSTTALHERIYCVKNPNGSYSTGILIYVSAAGSDGTLGGLTSLVDKNILSKIVDRSFDRLLTCSNDPVCSERKFRVGRHRGAACHSCILAPETSCNYLNKFLDRNLVRGSLK